MSLPCGATRATPTTLARLSAAAMALPCLASARKTAARPAAGPSVSTNSGPLDANVFSMARTLASSRTKATARERAHACGALASALASPGLSARARNAFSVASASTAANASTMGVSASSPEASHDVVASKPRRATYAAAVESIHDLTMGVNIAPFMRRAQVKKPTSADGLNVT
jgi:hypothetical protein